MNGGGSIDIPEGNLHAAVGFSHCNKPNATKEPMDISDAV